MKLYLLVVGALLFLVACTANANVVKDKVIEVGTIIPLTGDASVYGLPVQKAMELARDEVNARGGVAGKQLALIFEDGKCQGKDGSMTMNKLVHVDGVKLVAGGLCSGETLGAAPIAEANSVVQISYSSTNPAITDAGEFIYRIISSDALQGTNAAERAYEMGLKRAVVFHITNEYGDGLARMFTQGYEAVGGEILYTAALEIGRKDFKTELNKALYLQPDVIFFAGQQVEYLQVLKQAAELGIDTVWIGTETMNDPTFIETIGAAGEGVNFMKPYTYDGWEASAFDAAYRARFGEEPGVFSAYAYDVIGLFATAIDACGSDDSLCVKEYLDTHTYRGATGEIVFDENGDVNAPYSMVRIKNGAVVAVE